MFISSGEPACVCFLRCSRGLSAGTVSSGGGGACVLFCLSSSEMGSTTRFMLGCRYERAGGREWI